MSRIRLPDGVPSDNQDTTRQAFGSNDFEAPGFRAPDTATPDFAIPASNEPAAKSSLAAAPGKDERSFVRAPELAPSFARVTIETDEDEDDDDEEELGIVHGPHTSTPILILVAIGLLLIAFAAFFMSRDQGDPGLPDCASQPEWNQYNCRTN